MNHQRSLQDAIDQFTDQQADAYDTFELLIEYLCYFSDLAKDAEDVVEMDVPDWEKSLESLMEQLLDGDTSPSPDVEFLQPRQLDAEHLRDFLAWFLLRETDIDSLQIQQHGELLRQWLLFMKQQGMLESTHAFALLEGLDEALPEAVRACQAAHVLFYIVRHGLGSAPRQREKMFESFVEGHARIVSITGEHVILGFDNLENYTVQLALPAALVQLLRPGDVLDVELGLRGQCWQIVDSGPVYPPCVYMEADYFDVPEKLIPGDAD